MRSAVVSSLSIVRLMLILSQILRLATAQVDYVSAFVQSPMDEDAFTEMPRGFKEEGMSLKLKRSLYGLR
jgi:hypothetical protein